MLSSIEGRFVVSHCWKAEGPCFTRPASGTTSFSRFLFSGEGATVSVLVVTGSGSGVTGGVISGWCNWSSGTVGAELVAWPSFSRAELMLSGRFLKNLVPESIKGPERNAQKSTNPSTATRQATSAALSRFMLRRLCSSETNGSSTSAIITARPIGSRIG